MATRQLALLDPIIIVDDMQFLDAGTPPNISDHKATYIRFPFHYLCQSTYKRLACVYKRADFNKLKELIINFDWNVLLEGSLNDAYIKFTDTFLDFAKSCMPLNCYNTT